MRVCILSFSAIQRDTRVLRTISALQHFGHDVSAIGFGPAPPQVKHFVQLPAPGSAWMRRIAMGVTQAPANFSQYFAVQLHFLRREHRAARAALIELAPDVVHANDWASLPAAVAAKRAKGTRIVYDSHEFATQEHIPNLAWRLVAKRHTEQIERRGIAHADKVVTVSESIADELQRLYALPTRPIVTRNVPKFESVMPAPLGNPIRMLFHGLLKADRGIEKVIMALRTLPNHRLTLRGTGSSGYIAGLKRLTQEAGVAGQVAFEAAVSPEQVVTKASESHIGIFCGDNQLLQQRHALPNKVFEYIMAGLAVVVTAETDLARLIGEYHCGLTVQPSADAISREIGNLSLDEINRMRCASLDAAHELCWENEQEKLRAIYDSLALARQHDRGASATD